MVQNKSRNAFSLIELMIVVSIIAILASIAMPMYSDFIVRAQISEAISLPDDIKPRIKDFYLNTGRFPKNNKEAGIPEPEQLIGNYVVQIKLENGALHVQLGNKVRKELLGKILTIRPIIVTGSPTSPISWIAGYDHAPKGMEPVGENYTDVDPNFLPFTLRRKEITSSK